MATTVKTQQIGSKVGLRISKWTRKANGTWEKRKRRRGKSWQGSLFGEVRSVSPSWFRREVRKHMREEGIRCENGLRRAIFRRADSIEMCGKYVMVRECECGEARAGSGRYHSITCKLRSCPSCSWVRSWNIGKLLKQGMEQMEEVDGYEWQFLVLTTKYNPKREEDVTVKALRSRAILCEQWCRNGWKKVLKAPGAALFRATECSSKGMVHANLVYYGPPVDKEALSKVCFDPRRGRIHVDTLEARDVQNVARYAAKGMDHERSGYDEQWLSGETFAWVPHPKLAARWEIASYRMRLVARCGAFRGIEFEEHKAPEPADDSADTCSCCGQTGHWTDRRVRTEVWIQDCHDKNQAAMEGSGWHPGMRQKHWGKEGAG